MARGAWTIQGVLPRVQWEAQLDLKPAGSWWLWLWKVGRGQRLQAGRIGRARRTVERGSEQGVAGGGRAAVRWRKVRGVSSSALATPITEGQPHPLQGPGFVQGGAHVLGSLRLPKIMGPGEGAEESKKARRGGGRGCQ